eukprot:GGOE01053628.1.p1 GENE.GGOE01053628.1~~GGOE01053628.1.p1  ORF type:complete len:797 (-),score=202.06 GGOE01053628.1:719-3064(-)
MAQTNNVTLHVGGTDFSTPTDGLMALLRGIQVKKGSNDIKVAEPQAVPFPQSQEEPIVQQQILQLQNQLRLLQQLSQPQQGPQQLQQLFLQQLQQRQVQSAGLTPLISPLQTTQMQAAVQQQLQLQQLLQLQQRRQQQQQQQQQQQHLQLQRHLLQHQFAQQQLAQQQLLQLHQQQHLQFQLQEHFRRQQEPLPVAKPPSPLESVQLNLMQAKALPAAQFSPPVGQTPGFPPPPPPPLPPKPDSKPPLQMAASPPQGASMDVSQKLQLLHQLQQLGVQQRVTLSQPSQPPASPPVEPTPTGEPAADVAKTNLLRSMLGGKPDQLTANVEPSATAKSPDGGIDIMERLRLGSRSSDADGMGKKRVQNDRTPNNASASDAVNANKTGLVCSLLGVHGDKAAPPPPINPAGGPLDLLKGLPQLSPFPVMVPPAQPLGVDLSALSHFGAAPSIPPLPTVSTSMAPVVLPSANPISLQPSSLSLAGPPLALSSAPAQGTGAFMQQLGLSVNPIVLPFATSTSPLAAPISSLQSAVEPGIAGAAVDPLAGLATQFKRMELEGSAAPPSEVSPVIKALQLHQVLAQAGAGPTKFSHVSTAASSSSTSSSSNSNNEPNLVLSNKGQEEALMRIQAGEQGITNFQWLVNLVSKKSKESAPPVPAVGLGTWLHTEGKEPMPLTSGPPPLPDTASRLKVNMQEALDKKVYSHNFLKELQFCKAAGTTPSLIPQELIRDPNDDRHRPSDSGHGRPYDEHDHRSRDSHSDDDEREAGWSRGGRKVHNRIERRWR